jgi:hypothetical protein
VPLLLLLLLLWLLCILFVMRPRSFALSLLRAPLMVEC